MSKVIQVFDFKKGGCYPQEVIQKPLNVIAQHSRKPKNKKETDKYGISEEQAKDAGEYDIFEKNIRITIEIF